MMSSTANGYRLPTEAEWEYACRAGTTTAYNFGDDASSLGNYAWYGVSYDDGGKTHEVGKKPANAWGLYDMHGNVHEWCYDRLGSYGTDSVSDPVGADTGVPRVLRGGGWSHSARMLRSAYRREFYPAETQNFTGLRVVRGLD